MKPRRTTWTLSALALTTTAFAQQPLSFEVASIKPSDHPSMGTIQIGMDSDAGMVRYTNISLKDCIRAAYGVRDFQVQDPEWLDNARFDITAKLPAGVREDQIPEMLQSLLAERFKLSIRHDRKEQPVYALTPGKDGPRLKPAEIRTNDQGPKMLGVDGRPRSMMMFRFLAGEARVTAPSATLANLTALLSRFTERPVVDMTGIPGQYDFDLTFAPETTRGLPAGDGPLADPDTASEPAPSLSVAVQKYGLRLEARKAPMEIIVVTHAEKTPSEN
ncbi:MAG TPA: TIGR03435 family protein [Bryobacteraceae bacterium]|nr:TIGR03435 family protein [Bryobacteraceae bacterium]